VALRGFIATADMPTLQAYPQMEPWSADQQTLLAPGDLVGESKELDVLTVCAQVHLGRAWQSTRRTTPRERAGHSHAARGVPCEVGRVTDGWDELVFSGDGGLAA